jgi:hypothetical protein
MSGTRPWIAAAGLLILIAPSARGQVAFAPQVGSFPNGVVMSATPAVSFDRRYVRLGMNPQFTVLEGIDPFLIPAAVSGGPGGGLGGGGGGGGAGGVVGLAGMNGPIAGPAAQASLPRSGGDPGGYPAPAAGFGGSSDFEDQLRPAATPARPPMARQAPSAKARRKGGTSKPARINAPAPGRVKARTARAR